MPISKDLPSPNELMYGGKVRGIIPINKTKKNEINQQMTRKILNEKQNNHKYYHDKTAHHHHPIKLNKPAYVQLDGNTPLEKALVTKKCERPRS